MRRLPQIQTFVSDLNYFCQFTFLALSDNIVSNIKICWNLSEWCLVHQNQFSPNAKINFKVWVEVHRVTFNKSPERNGWIWDTVENESENFPLEIPFRDRLVIIGAFRSSIKLWSYPQENQCLITLVYTKTRPRPSPFIVGKLSKNIVEIKIGL